MTWVEDAPDRESNNLDIVRVPGEFVGGEFGEVRDVSTTKDNRHVTDRNGVPFEDSLTGSAAVKRTAG